MTAALYFTAAHRVEVRDEARPAPGAGQVLVRTIVSGISAGTEMLIYRGLAPAELPADEHLTALAGTLAFPLKYGYAAVGEIVEVGQGVGREHLGRRVFAFHPHQTHFVVPLAEAFEVPAGLAPEQAVLLPNAETAVNLVHDGRPMAGEQIVVFGQGIVGLLTTALLARHAPAALVTFDRHALRRRSSLALGATASLEPLAPDEIERFAASLGAESGYPGADLTYELTGDPATLEPALRVTGFDGRVIIGSWYGRQPARLDLGGRFHRSRIRTMSSQVSTIAPDLRGRWSRTRRLRFALAFLESLRPSTLITHRIPFAEAERAYRCLADDPSEVLQVVLTYPDEA